MANRLVSARLDSALLGRVRRSLGAQSDSEALRMALELAADLARTKQFVRRWGGKGGARAFESVEPRHP